MFQKKADLKGHKASIYALALAEDAQHIFSASGEGWLVHWDLENPDLGKLVAKVDGNIFSICYLSELHWIVLGDMYGGVHWIDLNAPEDQRNIAHHRNGVFAIQRVGDSVFTAGGKGILTKWSIEKRRAVESLQLSSESLRSIDYSPTRNELLIGTSDHSIHFLDAENFSLKNSISLAHDNSVFVARYHPDGKHIVSGGRDARLKIWDLESLECINNQEAHWYTINDIVFHPKGHLFATASRDKTIKIWDAQTFQLLKVLETIRDDGHINSVNRLLWTTHQDHLISCSDDRLIKIWEEKL